MVQVRAGSCMQGDWIFLLLSFWHVSEDYERLNYALVKLRCCLWWEVLHGSWSGHDPLKHCGYKGWAALAGQVWPVFPQLSWLSRFPTCASEASSLGKHGRKRKRWRDIIPPFRHLFRVAVGHVSSNSYCVYRPLLCWPPAWISKGCHTGKVGQLPCTCTLLSVHSCFSCLIITATDGFGSFRCLGNVHA